MVQFMLRQIREKCLMTRKEASDKSGIPVRTLGRWERDCRNANAFEIVRLLKVYKVPIDSLYVGHEDDAPENREMAVPEHIVAKGRTTALFQLAVEIARSSNDFDESWTPEGKEKRRQDVIEAVKRQFGEAIRAQYKHCGQPLTVRCVHDFDTRRHALLVRCDCCGNSVEIKESREAGEKENTASAAV